MNERIEQLTIEIESDGYILLTQDNCGDESRIAVHPTQLRFIAERAGLVETSDPQALRTIATLTRRLLVLRDRIDHLGDYLTHQSDHTHANLDYELAYITATADIANEFCTEFLYPLPTVADTAANTPAPATAPN